MELSDDFDYGNKEYLNKREEMLSLPNHDRQYDSISNGEGFDHVEVGLRSSPFDRNKEPKVVYSETKDEYQETKTIQTMTEYADSMKVSA
jgi:hypothetical protein